MQQLNFVPRKLCLSDRQAIIDAYGSQQSKALAEQYGITFKYVQDIWRLSGKSEANKVRKEKIKLEIIALQGIKNAKEVAALYGKEASSISSIWARAKGTNYDQEQPAAVPREHLVAALAKGNMLLAVLGFEFNTHWR